MAISVLSKTTPTQIGDNLVIQFFNCAFSTTDLTGTVPSGMRKVLFRSAFSFLDETSSDEVINWANANNADGSAILATGEKLSISRGAMSPTSALKFGFFILGYV